jgi:hypothetical protein
MSHHYDFWKQLLPSDHLKAASAIIPVLLNSCSRTVCRQLPKWSELSWVFCDDGKLSCKFCWYFSHKTVAKNLMLQNVRSTCFLGMLFTDATNCQDCMAWVMDDMVWSTGGMILTAETGGQGRNLSLWHSVKLPKLLLGWITFYFPNKMRDKILIFMTFTPCAVCVCVHL